MHRGRANSNSLSFLPRNLSYAVVLDKLPQSKISLIQEPIKNYKLVKNASDYIKRDKSANSKNRKLRFIPYTRHYVQLSPTKDNFDLKGKSMEQDRKSLEKIINYEKVTKRALDIQSQLKSFNLKSARFSIMKKIEMLKTPQDKENAVKAEAFLKEVKGNNVESVQKMLQADNTLVNLFDSTKQTALHWACRRGFIGMVQLLINFKASLSLPDMIGRTPEDIARSKNSFEIIDLFTRTKRLQRQATTRFYQ